MGIAGASVVEDVEELHEVEGEAAEVASVTVEVGEEREVVADVELLEGPVGAVEEEVRAEAEVVLKEAQRPSLNPTVTQVSS